MEVTASWVQDALFQPEPRARYRAMLELGYADAFRSLHPGDAGQFTFWDYFRQAFEHNRGIRIDHFLLTPGLVKRLKSCEIDKGPRGLQKPSDHTPIVLQLKSGFSQSATLKLLIDKRAQNFQERNLLCSDGPSRTVEGEPFSSIHLGYFNAFP